MKIEILTVEVSFFYVVHCVKLLGEGLVQILPRFSI